MGALQAATAVASLGLGVAGQHQSNRQAKQMYQMQNNEINARQAEQEASARANLEIIQKQSEEREKRRLDLLKSELAKRRAIMGASGAGGGGSAEAVRLGLAKKSDREAEYDLEMDRFKIDEVTRNLDTRRRKNLMDLTSLGSFSAADDLLSYGRLLNRAGDIF